MKNTLPSDVTTIVSKSLIPKQPERFELWKATKGVSGQCSLRVQIGMILTIYLCLVAAIGKRIQTKNALNNKVANVNLF